MRSPLDTIPAACQFDPMKRFLNWLSKPKVIAFNVALAWAFALYGCATTTHAATTNAPITLQTNLSGQVPTIGQASTPTLLPGLSGIESVIIGHLVDDAPYVSNGIVGADVALLYNESNPVGKGKVGFYGDITVPTSQQSVVGIGAGEMAHRSFITPVTFNVGTTLTNLPTVIGKVYAFAGDGLLYDFTGKEVGNWACAGFYKNWDINGKINIGIKIFSFDDSVIPGIGYGGAFTGTF